MELSAWLGVTKQAVLKMIASARCRGGGRCEGRRKRQLQFQFIGVLAGIEERQQQDVVAGQAIVQVGLFA